MKTKETSKVICNHTDCNKEKEGVQTGLCNHCGRFGLTTREQAIAWWKQLKSNVQLNYWRNYQKTTFTPSHSPNELTGREIEEIWKNEVQVKELSNVYHNAEYLKPNQKQFKQFDESLFKSYIDKFSGEDKFKAFSILAKHFENYIYGFYKDGDFDKSQNNACYGNFKSRFNTLFE